MLLSHCIPLVVPSEVTGRCLPLHAKLNSAPKHTRTHHQTPANECSDPSIVGCRCLCGYFPSSKTTEWGSTSSQSKIQHIDVTLRRLDSNNAFSLCVPGSFQWVSTNLPRFGTILESIYVNKIRWLISNFQTFQAIFISNTCAFTSSASPLRGPYVDSLALPPGVRMHPAAPLSFECHCGW